MTDETVLITGASSGIGLELAKLFAADQSNLILVARSEDKLHQLAGDLRDLHGIHVRVIPKDLADPDAPQAIFDELEADRVVVDVLVNNAGFGAAGWVIELPTERQIDMIQVNVTALARLAMLFVPAMLERERGGVLNVASIAAFQPGPYMAVYFATKAFVLSFSEALAEELAGVPVRVSCLAPGPTHSGFRQVSGLQNARLFHYSVMDAPTVALAGYRGFRRGQLIVVPGWTNKIMAASVRFLPRWFVRKTVMWLQGPA